MCTCVTGHHPGLWGPIPQKPQPADPHSLELLAKPHGQEGLVGDTAPCNPETCRQDPERGWRRSRAQDQLPAASGGRRWGERAGKAECAQSEPAPQWPPGRRRDPPVSQPGSPGSLPRSHAADHLTQAAGLGEGEGQFQMAWGLDAPPSPCSHSQAASPPARPSRPPRSPFPSSFQAREKERVRGEGRAVRGLRRGGRLRVPRRQAAGRVGGRLSERLGARQAGEWRRPSPLHTGLLRSRDPRS